MTIDTMGFVTIPGRVIIGQANSSYNGHLYIEGGDSENLNGVVIRVNSAGTYAVYGKNNNGSGVFGESAGVGSGVFGYGGPVGVTGYSQTGTGLVARSASGFLVEGFPSFNGGTRTFHIDLNGTYVAGSDFAESLPARGDKSNYEPGDVLVISTQASGSVEKSSRPYDPRVAGVYSTRPGMLGADKGGATRVDPNDVPVAIIGIVPTKVSAENGAVRVGDMLTTSRTPGFAMRCGQHVKCLGTIIGKAIEPLKKGRGIIKVLVTLR
jgi:hypothetical protein